MMSAALAASAVLASGPARAAAPADMPDPVEQLARAKAVFERTCNVCHGLERPLSKTFDEAGWVRTVERMHDNGAEASGAERSQIVAFLLAKNLFEAKCSVCHGIDRPLAASKRPAEWLETVRRMSGKKPGSLSDAEAAGIAAYLSITRPLP
jgi:mono/diheme cytochrome c family protein